MFRHRIERRTLGLTTCLLGLIATSCGGGAEESAADSPAAPAPEARTAAAPSAPAETAPAPTAADLPVKVVDSPAELAAVPRPEGLDLPAADPVLGDVLVINGEIIPHDVIRREVILGPRGRSILEMKKLEVLMNQEIARQVAGGASEDSFQVSDEEVASSIAETEEQVRSEFPDDDVALEELFPGGALNLANQIKITQMFLKTFMPERAPAEWPASTLAAFDSTEQGKMLFQALEKEWETTQEGGKPEQNPMFQQMVFQSLQEYLFATSQIEEGEDLPPSILMRINGDEIMTDEVWEVLAPGVSVGDVRTAKQWLTNLKILEQDLGEQWLSPEEAALKYAEHAAPYEDSMFSVERVAMMVKKYPSERAYRQYRRAYDSFQQQISDQLTPDNLRAFAEQRTKLLIGQTNVDVDIILVSAYDFKKQAWKPNGWNDATERAKEVLRRLVEKDLTWDDAVEEYSEFYDPPIPASFTGQLPPRKSKGRFRAMPRNQLMQNLDESEYWQFLNGRTITDFVFFEQNEGDVAKPMRGPYGWYIPRLLRRADSPPLANIADDQLVKMAEQDYTLVTLSEHIQALIDQAQVYGLN